VKYLDGSEILVGDVVSIDGQHWGTVIASFDSRQFSEEFPEREWFGPDSGVVVSTDFAGVVHYPSSDHVHFALVRRK